MNSLDVNLNEQIESLFKLRNLLDEQYLYIVKNDISNLEDNCVVVDKVLKDIFLRKKTIKKLINYLELNDNILERIKWIRVLEKECESKLLRNKLIVEDLKKRADEVVEFLKESFDVVDGFLVSRHF